MKTDYYHYCEQNATHGCCLLCEPDHKGQWTDHETGKCLCPQCKCRMCIHLEDTGFENPETGLSVGECTLADEWREQSRGYFKIKYDYIVHSTEKAHLIRFSDGNDVWAPRSVMRGMDEIQSWFLEKKELLAYRKRSVP